MFILNIYNSFETGGHCRDQGDFYILKSIISFNSHCGKIKMKNSYNYYHHEKPVCRRLRCRNVPHSICKENNVPRKNILVHK